MYFDTYSRYVTYCVIVIVFLVTLMFSGVPIGGGDGGNAAASALIVLLIPAMIAGGMTYIWITAEAFSYGYRKFAQ